MCIAVVWRIVWGDIERPRREGRHPAAATAARSRRWATFERVIFPPLRLGSRKLSAEVDPNRRRHRRTVDAVGRQSGTPRSLRDRKSVVEGKSVSVRGDLGGRRIFKKKKRTRSH